MDSNHIDIVSCESGDWVCVYVNGVIEHEGHTINTSNWIDLINKYKHFYGGINRYEVSDEYMEIRLPKRFKDIPKSELN